MDENLPEMTKPKSKFNPKILVFISSLIVGILIGLIIGQKSSFLMSLKKNATDQPVLLQAGMIRTSSLFQSQSAIIQGKITKVENSSLTIEDKNKHSESFPIASTLVIYIPTSNSPISTASADLKFIKINELATILLQVIDSHYKIVSISYPNNFVQKPSLPNK